MRILIVALLVSLAGCAGPGGADDTSLPRHEAPTPWDLWGDDERLTVMDETIDTTAFTGGSSPTFRVFTPPGIVPQGTDHLTLAISQVSTFRNHGEAKLAYQTAEDDAWREAAGFAMGSQTTIPVPPGAADPPGQQISSWAFRLFYPPEMTALGVGSVSQAHVEITAIRGDELPRLDAREAWDREPLLLFTGGGTVSGAYDGADCYGITGCPAPKRPLAPIPEEARIVEVTVDHSAGFQPVVRFHTGQSWAWSEVDPALSAPTQTVFRIPVEEPDSPYATKSAWAFAVRSDAPTSLDPTVGQFSWQGYALA